MIHLPHLISDLGLILAAAAITTLIFKKLKQPLVLGYIIAGLLVGPHISLVPTVTDTKSVEVWAEIGVIFLLFSLGLEFSFKKLLKVGGSASITALLEVVAMLALGFGTGKLLGWSNMDSVFLGGILSISSTTIIIRAFDELGIKSQKFARLVFGVLVVEDLVAILLLVLLSTLAVSRQFEGTEMLYSVLKLGFFLILWFLAGIFLLPTFLRRTQKLMNDETMLIVSLALCLMMVVLATKAGFSPALGAFIMGSILAETTQAEKIEHLVKSVKDLFAAVFFVSVGMLINPAMLGQHLGPILLITLVTIFGKSISSGLGALLSGQPLKQSVQTGLSLAQIGEFSFIIATLGLTLKVTSDFLYPIAVAVSAITTFTTPYLIKASEPFYNFIQNRLPDRWQQSLNRYSSETQVISTAGNWQIILKSYFLKVGINSIVIIAIILLFHYLLAPFIYELNFPGIGADILIVSLTLLAMAPFLWALAISRNKNHAYNELWHNRSYSRVPLIALKLVKVLLAVAFTGFLFSLYFPFSFFTILILSGLGFLFFMFSQKFQNLYKGIEKRFLINLNERENAAALSPAARLLPWDAHLTVMEVAPESPLVGKTLESLSLREQFGVIIAFIERGKIKIPVPGRNDLLFPGDKISVIGTDEQLENFKNQVESDMTNPDFLPDAADISLQKILLNPNNILVGKTIRNSGIRETARGLVVGIERDGHRILNPDSLMTLEPEDIVWVVGDTKKLKKLADY